MKNTNLESWEVKVAFILFVLMIIFSGRAKAQECNCDCDIKQYEAITDTVKLDSLFRHEQLTIMNIQRDMIKDDSKDLRDVFNCHALKMEVIYKRLEEVKFKIEKP